MLRVQNKLQDLLTNKMYLDTWVNLGQRERRSIVFPPLRCRLRVQPTVSFYCDSTGVVNPPKELPTCILEVRLAVP
jgi:hypothetical protein